MEEFKNRLLAFIESHCKMSIRSFEETCGLTNGTVSSVKKKGPGADHTARRSGASILYKSGVPIRICRFLTGHQTDSMFLNYVKVSKDEGAELLAKSDFFK